ISEDVAVITAQGGEDFWITVHNGAIAAGKKYNLSIYIRRAGNDKTFLDQSNAILNAVDNGCKVIIVAPIDIAQMELITKLKNKGIPTIFIDRDIGGDREIIIKTNNFNMGKNAAYEMAKILSPGSKIALLRMENSLSTTTEREEGFITGAKEKGLIIALDTYIGTSVGDARVNTKKALENIKEIDGIFTPNETTAMGTIAALRDLNRSKNIVHIAIDLSDYMKNAIRTNELYGAFIQKPFDMGYLGVEAAKKILDNIKITDIETESEFITIDNL
ncbi:MAG: substrate-binding domain-containing protein, partial [Spirochaetales bacterium]|nr:substrate-binding domain-containing protein [Spirochaetales bacterium]